MVVREAFKDLLKGWARSRDLVFVTDYTEKVINLLMRVPTGSVRTVAITNSMKHGGR